jgi:hypothetical protein
MTIKKRWELQSHPREGAGVRFLFDILDTVT